MPRYLRMLRVAEWGVQLIVLWIVAGIYALGLGFEADAYRGRVAIVTAWTALLLAGAYMFNAFADRHDDALDPAHRREAATHPTLVLTISLALLAAGLVAMWRFEPAAIVRALTLVQVGVLFAYSLPFPRLKERGWAGLAAASVFQRVPSFIAVVLAFPLERVRAAALVVWLIALGLLFIMEHQVEDFAADRHAGVRTWAATVGVERARAAKRNAYRCFGFVSLGCAVVLATTGAGTASWLAAAALLTAGAATVALFRRRYRRSVG